MRGIRRRSLVTLLALFGLAAGLTVAGAPSPAAGQEAEGEIRQAADPVPGQYLVKLTGVRAADVPAVADDLADENNGEVIEVYQHALRGFAVEMSEAKARELAADPNVAYVEEDAYVHSTGTQNNPPWGLDRTDQRDLPLSTTYTYGTTGAGVDAYIIDTGIRTAHQEFGGRATVGTDTIGDGQNGQDCNGHGTHVAGTVGGATYGIAKNVSLIAVRVLSCSGSGSNAGVIAGVDWVTANRNGPSVANMSLGGGISTALDTAVQNSINSGVTYAIAAGNDNGGNACNSSPARVGGALTVGSSTITDSRSSFSNIGTCLDLFAPGSNILSSWYTSNSATNTISGTSMATPHVAGAAAVYLEANPSAAPSAVNTALVNAATPNKVTAAGTGSPNRLLFVQGVPPTTGSITVMVDAAPDAPQDFSFSGCSAFGCADFTLDDDGAPPIARSKQYVNVPPGNYVVTQNAAPGWTLTTLTCNNGETVDLANRRATISLEAGDATVCTFTNRAPGITIVLDAQPDSGTDVPFNGCSSSVCAPFTLDDDANATLPRSVAHGPLPPGTYTVSQGAVSGLRLSSLTCDTGETVDLAGRSVTIDLSAGERTTCTFVEVPAPPANDPFANAQAITGASGTTTGTNLNATKETGEPNHFSAGGKSIWYVWTAPRTGTLTVNTNGSNYDTLLAAYTGSAVNALTSRASDDDAGDGLQSLISFPVTAGTTYRIAVDGYNAASGNVTLNWNLP